MDALLSDINQAGLGRGLQFELFRPGQVAVKDYYAELPIAIKVSGRYHDLGAFAADIANLSRIVTLHNLSIGTVRDSAGLLSMEATARTYRYLDASELEVEDVIVFGKIDGGSRLRIGAVKKRVTFQAKIDGRSTVEVIAPTAIVMFLDTKGREVTGIAGGSVVRVTAHVMSFLGHIRGADTVVTVTVARGGSVGFVEIDGAARFEYRKAAPADPDPVLSRGKVGAAATVSRVE